jgi:hypothetical protein
MSEEVRNASTDVPRSMLMSLAINGTLAVGMLLAVLFSAHDIENLLLEESVLSPFIRIFRDAVGSSAGATVMVSVIIALEFCSAMGCLAAASRMTWSFARDRGLPFSHSISIVSTGSYIEQVHPTADQNRLINVLRSLSSLSLSSRSSLPSWHSSTSVTTQPSTEPFLWFLKGSTYLTYSLSVSCCGVVFAAISTVKAPT